MPLQQSGERTARLNIDSRVVHQLGDELITDTGQALLELVKNAYDADSPDCLIRVDTSSHWILVGSAVYQADDPALVDLEDDLRKSAKALRGHVSVTDRGEGMSVNAIINGWLVISVSGKKDFKA